MLENDKEKHTIFLAVITIFCHIHVWKHMDVLTGLTYGIKCHK